MRILLLGLLLCAGLQAQSTSSLAFYLDNSGGQQPVSSLQSFPATYTFPDTPVGSSSVIGVRVVNSSVASTAINSIGFVSGTQQNNNFTSDLPFGLSLAPNEGQFFHIYFVPLTTGAISASAQIGTGGTVPVNMATLAGNGTATQLGLSCTSVSTVVRCDGSILQPDETTALNFGSIRTTSSLAVTFTLVNAGTTSINPQQIVALNTATNNPSSGFSLGTLPASIAAGSSGTFTITFAPGNTTTNKPT